MAATKVQHVISRLPGCGGQESGAVLACTQVNMEDAPKQLELPESECPANKIRDLVVRLERHVYEHPLAGLLWE